MKVVPLGNIIENHFLKDERLYFGRVKNIKNKTLIALTQVKIPHTLKALRFGTISFANDNANAIFCKS